MGDDIYYPLPIDCVTEKDKPDNNVVSILSMSKNENENINSCPTDWILSRKGNKKVENVIDRLIRGSMFKKYLKLENTAQFSIIKLSDFIISEPKIGIGIDKGTHTSEEGRLYRVDMRRFKNSNGSGLTIAADLDGLDIPEKGIVKLGGEGKAASYSECEDNFNMDFPGFKQDEKLFKLIITTKAIFKNGWLPGWINEETLEGKYNGLTLKLLTASIGKPINIGGFDMKRRIPKPMYKATLAGSVYYFKIIAGDIKKAFKAFNETAISDVYPEQGFGIAFVGKL